MIHTYIGLFFLAGILLMGLARWAFVFSQQAQIAVWAALFVPMACVAFLGADQFWMINILLPLSTGGLVSEYARVRWLIPFRAWLNKPSQHPGNTPKPDKTSKPKH